MIIAFLLLMDIVVRSAVLHNGFSEYTASPAGLGYSEIDNVKTYRQKCMLILYSSIIRALAVLFIDCALTGLPNGPGEWGELDSVWLADRVVLLLGQFVLLEKILEKTSSQSKV
ncbi:hypothetical protein P4U97_02665 [Bacillus swezeyi]|uniref:hypothetical protein n=1 Tax=Bacillus swezeyi TaxID=1925020 RepID=UPI002E22C35C|nr:hypothetical protein [Bacillus swezeyi]